ncbi:hypothetical protein BU16DRAFT_536175 [Lophium mytilinum]|uniref:Uncharacterized protein n=1 Tax=Lophium mytilinum TaxID=390894 RepID=A0A6A6R670_9PEZI|nr:hypothetical protein BU16DRAFT_536175 [Lophium mytilinum]
MDQQTPTLRTLPKIKVSHWPHIIYIGDQKWAELECYLCHGNGSDGNGTHAFKFLSGITAFGVHLSRIHGVKLEHDEIQAKCTARVLRHATLVGLLNGTARAAPVEKRGCEMMTVEEKESEVSVATRDEIDTDLAAVGLGGVGLEASSHNSDDEVPEDQDVTGTQGIATDLHGDQAEERVGADLEVYTPAFDNDEFADKDESDEANEVEDATENDGTRELQEDANEVTLGQKTNIGASTIQ